MEAEKNQSYTELPEMQRMDASTCPICLLQFKDKYVRKRHQSSVHERQNRDFKCSVCDKSYTNINALKYHVALHTEEAEKPTCKECGSQPGWDNNGKPGNQVATKSLPSSEIFGKNPAFIIIYVNIKGMNVSQQPIDIL